MRKLVVFIGTIAIIGFVAIYFRVPELQITAGNGALEGELSAIIREHHYLLTSSNAYAKILEGHPLVERAKVQKALLKRLNVQITLMAPFAAIKSGHIYVMIDSQGTVLELSDKSKAPYVIEGFSVQFAEVGRQVVTENADLIVKAVQLVDLYERFSSIQPDVHLIDGELIQKMNAKLWVNYGKGYDITKQFNAAMSIYDDMLQKKSNTGIINLSVPGQTVIQTWKN